MQIDNLGQAEVKWSGTGRAVVQVIITLIPLYTLNEMIKFRLYWSTMAAIVVNNHALSILLLMPLLIAVVM